MASEATTYSADQVRTFLVKPEFLEDSKCKIKKGDKQLQKALRDLVAQADKALQSEPYSVTYKSKVPPSGDKHDYMSVGPYWWPDSTKADGLPYIRKDGQVNPERFSIKDADYHGSLCRDVYRLSLAWYFTGETKYSDQAAKLLRIWFLDKKTRMNPNLNFGQAIPGRTDGRGIGIIDTRALAVLIDGVQLLKDSKSLSAADYHEIQDWYRAFLNWMRTSPIGLDEADEHNNHGTWYDVQTVSMALFTGQPDLAKEILEQQTKKRISSQLDTSGAQPHELARTVSWNYSMMNLQGFFQLAALGDNVGIDLWNYVTPDGKSIKSAFKWMLPFAQKKKEWTHQQIKPIKYDGFFRIAKSISKKYPDMDLSGVKEGNDQENSLLLLTNANL
ncbi:alginate lyase family protein [Dyadobacter chenhuakuii]|uniref:Alginate lyase family protein n=1 Tax=Dyadobacter chenhuakuii TaxID=2909339 RepID=A0ABY4XM00_9BACT|nr:alginate lyase family protein [Dyadobacter chenhuakuii]MCF2494143.1 alginate lyase family protein [Dyadobacter chenhuakuii]USJ31271.1 alginate lyase family protein [Dyadobacter chenhuakuii]